MQERHIRHNSKRALGTRTWMILLAICTACGYQHWSLYAEILFADQGRFALPIKMSA